MNSLRTGSVPSNQASAPTLSPWGGDPVDEIERLQSIHFVMKDGVVYKGEGQATAR